MATINLPDDMPDDVKELFGQSIIDVVPSYQYAGDAGDIDPSRTSYTAVVNNPEGGVTRYSYDPTQGLLNTGSFGSYEDLMKDAQDDDIFTQIGDFGLKAAPIAFAAANLYNLVNGLGGAAGTEGLTQLGGPGLESVVVSTPADLVGADLIGADLTSATGALPLDQVGALNPPTGLDSLPTSQFPGDLVKPEVNLGGMTSEGALQNVTDFTSPDVWDYTDYGSPLTSAQTDAAWNAALNEAAPTYGVDVWGNTPVPDTVDWMNFGLSPTEYASAAAVAAKEAATKAAAAKAALDKVTNRKPTQNAAGNTTYNLSRAKDGKSLLELLMVMNARGGGGDGGIGAADAARREAQALTRG